MTSFSRTQLFVACLFFALLSQVIGHSYVTSPVSRSNQRQSNTGCRGPLCFGPCDTPKSNIVQSRVQTAARGSSIRVDWPRNNHAAGFIRFAWALTSDSDNHAAFDSHVQQINCHEVGGCRSSSSDPNGGDNGPADGSSSPCTITITVPLDLTDGQWTLQWAWFGGAFALGDYYSCVDYRISGGPTGDLTPRFIGGDVSNPGQQKCKYFNTERLHRCVNEPCDNPVMTLYSQSNGAPFGFTSSPSPSVTSTSSTSGSTTTTTTTTTTTGRASTSSSSSTTGRPATSTSTSSTTGRPASSTSTSTTGRPASSTSTSTTGGSRPASSTSTSSTGSTSINCAGATGVSTARAHLTSVDTWGNQFHANILIDGIDATLSDWVVEVSWRAPNHISQVFAGGSLQCEGPQTSYFKPSAEWANNIAAGSTLSFDFIGTNANAYDKDTIMANTQLRVLKM